MITTHDILLSAREARPALQRTSTEEKNAALLAMADALERNAAAILAANAQDMEAARGHVSEVMLDRLALTEGRIAGMAEGVRQVAALPDPVGQVLREVKRPNGLVIRRVAVPMGVIAIIYESRPNVTSDAAALAVKAGSACVLRGGKEAFRSANAIVAALKEGLTAAGLPADLVNLVQDTSRESARELMTAAGLVDLLIPRGGAGLIRSCVENATVPCVETGTGICHVYVDAAADLDMALNIINNAKTSRPSVCNAEEVCLVHSAVAERFLPRLRKLLAEDRAAAGLVPVELRLDQRAAAIISGTPAGEADFDTEFLDYILAVKVVDSVRRPSPTSPPTPPTTPTPSLPMTRPPPGSSSPWWTARRCTGTPPPASPTAGSSVWAAKWASPPRSSTPGDPWGWRSCAPINMSSPAPGR